MDKGNWKRIEDILLPEPIAFAIHKMANDKLTGQIIINFNSGEPQSFEVKEHYRV